MPGIGIVGMGISGLQLALYLQRHGMDATVYSAQPPEALRDGQALNYAIRWAPTLQRERDLGLSTEASHACSRLRVRGPAGSGIDFVGALSEPGDGTDFRIYLPHLLQVFLARGGRLRVEACGPDELPGLTTQHDLVVVAVGRGGYGGVFPVDPARCPYRHPMRAWTAGTYRGLELPSDCQVEMSLAPGGGEVFHMAYRSRDGVLPVLSIGGPPGSPLDAARTISHSTHPREFLDAVLAVLRAEVPHVYTRIDRREFAPTDPRDLIQASITPTVRHARAIVAGRPVLAVGDAWILNDPLAAQGANLGSRSAFILGAAILEGGPYDDDFARRVEARMWEQAQAPCALSNVLLEPPPPHVLELLIRAGHDQPLANRFADGFSHPEQMLQLLAPVNAAA